MWENACRYAIGLLLFSRIRIDNIHRLCQSVPCYSNFSRRFLRRRVAEILELDPREASLEPVATLADELGGPEGEGGRRGAASWVEKQLVEALEGLDLLELLVARDRHRLRCWVENEVGVLFQQPGHRRDGCLEQIALCECHGFVRGEQTP